jgi:hypothetical protein
LPAPFLLRFDFLDCPLQFAKVLASKLPGLSELRHHRLRAAAEEAQDLVEKAMPRGVSRHERLKNRRAKKRGGETMTDLQLITLVVTLLAISTR